MQIATIDGGHAFDFGKTSENYAKYRDIYPESLYEKLVWFGIGKPGQHILDLGSGTAVLPRHMAHTGAQFAATDLSENQLRYGAQLVKEKGMDNIQCKVCSAEDTGFADSRFDAVTAVQCFHYFNAEKAAAEIVRVLKPGGLFGKIFMDWLPREDAVIAEMERLVLRYNPQWSGAGFDKFRYRYPAWAEGRFQIDTVHSYNVTLPFTKAAWLGRVLSCRGVGASLSPAQTAAFAEDYRALLEQYSEPLLLRHQIHIELYRSEKKM